MKTNYILIDYENVQPKSLALLNGGEFKVFVFVGAKQVKIPLEFAKTLQSFGTAADYIQISGNGTNALDFHIAFTIGELSANEPEAYFHIISKDTGFDPLIEYLRKRKILARRSKGIAEIPLLRAVNAKTTTERVDAIVHNFAARTGRPRKRETLINAINALFAKKLSEAELASLVKSLVKGGYVTIEDDSVSYNLPPAN